MNRVGWNEWDSREPPEGVGIDPDVLELHRELSALRIEERPSFAPELEAELSEVVPDERRPGRHVRHLALAASLSVALVGVSVPPARAALVRLIEAVQRVPQEVFVAPEPAVGTVATTVPAAEVFVPIERSEAEPPEPVDAPSWINESVSVLAPDLAYPSVVSLEGARALVARHYPPRLQLAGIGGTVHLVLWVEADGSVAEAEVASTSGIEDLDEAAVRAVRDFRFTPARRQGRAVGTWVEFDVQFVPPDAGIPEEPAVTEAGNLVDVGLNDEEWPDDSEVDRVTLTAQDMLRAALSEDGEDASADIGSVDALLTGEAPMDALPLAWRDQAVDALEEAIGRDPNNPAPFLALGRIRRKQGLPDDARRLFERGIDRASSSAAAIPPNMLADLHYERGLILREEWLPWKDLGQVPSMALGVTRCRRAGPRPVGPHVAADGIVAWNYLCAGHFDEILRDRFESLETLKSQQYDAMMAAFESAAAAAPGHEPANIEILLGLADSGEWERMAARARTFVAAADGSPHAFLLLGMAEHGLGRSTLAVDHLNRALDRLPREVSDPIRDVRALGDGEATPHGQVGAGSTWDLARRFWASRDPVLWTPVNEREVEHLARGSYAYLRFGGAHTDPGRVWVRYGAPNRIRSFGHGSGLRVELWDYGPGPDLTFQRAASSRRLDLTPEGSAYLDELIRLFPQRYRHPTDEVSFRAQLARFRTPAGYELEVHGVVPPTAATDSVEVSVFLQASTGDRWRAIRQVRAAEEGALHLTVPVDRAANRLAVEVVDRGTGTMAAYRTPVQIPGAGQRDDATPAELSDLLLVRPAAPFKRGQVSRDQFEARTDPAVPETDSVGVYLELYGAYEGRGYELWATAESLESGAVTPLPIRPAGELRYGDAWLRPGTRTWITPEYLTVDLRTLPAADYLLRVYVQAAEAPTLLTSRALTIR